MKDILRDWLHQCLQRKFNIENLGKDLSDGVLLIKLLKYYHVVNKKALNHIQTSDNPKVCENNLREIGLWFNLLGIKFDDEIISNITNGKTTTCLKLLYELYIVLNNKSRLQFINFEKPQTRTRISEPFVCKRDSSSPQEFEIEETEEEICSSIKVETFNERSLTPSKDQQPLSKKETLYERMRAEDIRFVRNELKNVLDTRLPPKKSLSPSTHQALLEHVQAMNEATEEEKANKQETQLDPTAIKTSNIRPKSVTLEQENQLLDTVIKPAGKVEQETLQTEISENILGPLDTETKPTEKTEREKLKTIISENILRQSEFEKQLLIDKLKSSLQENINKESFMASKKAKDEEPTDYMNFFSTCKTSEEDIAWQVEAIERAELHRKLYDETIRKRNKRHLSICQQIVKNVVTLAIKISEYGKESVTNELKAQWKESLILGESILDDPDDRVISIVNVDGENEDAEMESDPYFDEYCHLVGDWFLQSGADVSYDDLFILAHVVYRLKEAKLPPVIPMRPADVPRYRITSILNGTFDELTILKLKMLLFKSKICMIDAESAIAFCVARYKLEADIKPPETPSKKGKPEKTPSPDTAAKKGDAAAKKGGAGAKKGDTGAEKLTKSKEPPPVTQQDEEVQTTPSLFENIVKSAELSDAAKIGEYFYNLETPSEVSVKYMVDLLVEFIKSQSDIEGWVLVNFPSTLKEAYNLEKIFSGKMFPKIFRVSEEAEDASQQTLSEEASKTSAIIDVTPSRLVFQPFKKQDAFITYFTSFINVKQATGDVDTDPQNTDLKIGSLSHYTTETEEEGEEEEESVCLTAVYKDQGILQEFSYETMDFGALKNLARVILQCDNDVDKVPSNEIFDEEVIKFYDTIKKASSQIVKMPASKPPQSKKTPKGKDELTEAKELLERLVSTGKTTPSTAEQGSEEEEGEECQEETKDTESETIMFPGSDGWNYAKFPIFEEDETILLNLWDQLESTYINRVKDVICAIKKNDRLVVPYLNFITKTINTVNEEENCSKKIVEDFVQYFNRTLETRCLDEPTIKELSDGIFSVEQNLWQISDEKRNKLENTRLYIIEQGFTADEMIKIGNNYLSLMEIEVDRCNATLEFLYMYYSIMCGVQPSNEAPRIQPTNLSECGCDECKIRKSIAKLLSNKEETSYLNLVSKLLENAVQYYLTEVGRLKQKYDYIIATYNDFVISRKHEYQMKKIEEDNKNILQFKDPRTYSAGLVDGEGIAIFEAEDIDVINLFLEWDAAMKSEIDRLIWRIKIVKGRAIETLDILERCMSKIFHNSYDRAIKSYLQENKCIDDLCRIFHSGLKTGFPITGNVVDRDSCIYIEKVSFEDPDLPSFEVLIEDQIKPSCFTIEQLEIIAKELRAASNEGIIDRTPLRLIVEDMISHVFPDRIQPFPAGWSYLNPLELKQIFQDAFGTTTKIYWKDFILYCLDIPFPDIQDIVEHKNQFVSHDADNKGVVSHDGYSRITFWFEENTNGRGNYNKSVKEFLFSLFEVNENEFDYVDFLLSFSKGVNPVIGFTKALACLSGRCVAFSEQSAHLEDILFEYNELLTKTIREMIEEMLIGTLNNLYGVKIEELDEMIHESNALIELIPDAFNKKKLETVSDVTDSIEVEYEDEEGTVSIQDKESQTVSFTELMYDQYIAKNKIYNWTVNAPSELIYRLLENRVFPALGASQQYYDREQTVRDVKESVAKLEVDGLVHIPSLMREVSFHSMFWYAHLFQTFSFSSAVKDKPECLSFIR